MSEQKPSTGALMAAGIIAFETGRPSADRLRFAEIIDRETRVAELEETNASLGRSVELLNEETGTVSV